MLIEITSLVDPRLDPYRNLKQSNLTRWSGMFIAEGEKVTRRLLESDFETASVLLGQSYVEAFTPLISPQTPVFVLPDDDIEKLVGFNFHRGVLACGRRKPGAALADAAGRRADATIVVCPDVQDPVNLGAILRISAALGVDGILLGPRCADAFSRRVLRVSMGAALRLPIIESNDLPTDLRRIQTEFNYELVATVLDADAEPLQSAVGGSRTAILFGSEGHGLSQPLVEMCNRRVTIPMQLGTDSLNVAVAAGIVIYHYSHVARPDGSPAACTRREARSR